MIEVVTTVALVVLGVAGLLVLVAVLRARRLADRAVGVDLFTSLLLNALAVGVARTGRDELAILLVVLTLLGFVGTTTVARYIERRGTT